MSTNPNVRDVCLLKPFFLLVKSVGVYALAQDFILDDNVSFFATKPDMSDQCNALHELLNKVRALPLNESLTFENGTKLISHVYLINGLQTGQESQKNSVYLGLSLKTELHGNTIDIRLPCHVNISNIDVAVKFYGSNDLCSYLLRLADTIPKFDELDLGNKFISKVVLRHAAVKQPIVLPAQQERD